MKRLVVQEVCGHGEDRYHVYYDKWNQRQECEDFKQTVLDPERVLQIEDPEFGEISFIRVQDVLDALGRVR